MPQAVPSSLGAPQPGVQELDVRDPRRPVLAGTLTSPAFLSDPWRSLKVHPGRPLLAGVSGAALEGVVFFDLYDVADCRRPRLLNSVSETALSLPAGALGHQGAFSTDGRTYRATGGAPGTVAAVDVSDPARPVVVYTGVHARIDHGISFSPDSGTAYLSTIDPQGVTVLDVRQVRDRRPAPQVPVLGSLSWSDGANAQHTVPVTWGGRPHLVAVDEMASGGVRVLDVADPRRPRQAARLLLEVQLPQHASLRAQDAAGTGLFGYDAHYCSVDRTADPRLLACSPARLLACGTFHSGVRVFDLRDPRAAREVAYWNPPARTGRGAALSGSQHANGPASRGGATVSLTADWCSSPPRFVGRDALRVTCTDTGFSVLRFTRDPLRRSPRS